MTQTVTEERVEAVIISGPRKGEFIIIADGAINQTFGPGEEKLFDLELKFVKVETELRLTKEVIGTMQRHTTTLKEEVQSARLGMIELSAHVVRLEAQREADQARMKAEVAQFKVEAARTQSKLLH